MHPLLRPPAVAGMFYPDQAQTLSHDISALLAAAPATSLRPKALIVPHAGYIYSGPIAASAYSALKIRRTRIRRVVLLGPVHRVPVRGLATSSAKAFATPLGAVRIDQASVAKALSLSQVCISDEAHAQEHSLEVHLPFLQTLLDDFELVPFAVGNALDEEVAEVLSLLWGGDETLIVISSDLSHYHPYGKAQLLDRGTAESILRMAPVGSHELACGATPINGLLLAARQHGLEPHLLDLRNSGDTAGDKTSVVGYAAFAFCEHDNDRTTRR